MAPQEHFRSPTARLRLVAGYFIVLLALLLGAAAYLVAARG